MGPCRGNRSLARMAAEEISAARPGHAFSPSRGVNSYSYTSARIRDTQQMDPFYDYPPPSL